MWIATVAATTTTTNVASDKGKSKYLVSNLLSLFVCLALTSALWFGVLPLSSFHLAPSSHLFTAINVVCLKVNLPRPPIQRPCTFWQLCWGKSRAGRSKSRQHTKWRSLMWFPLLKRGFNVKIPAFWQLSPVCASIELFIYKKSSPEMRFNEALEMYLQKAVKKPQSSLSHLPLGWDSPECTLCLLLDALSSIFFLLLIR